MSPPIDQYEVFIITGRGGWLACGTKVTFCNERGDWEGVVVKAIVGVYFVRARRVLNK